MTPEQWQKVRELFEAALARNPAERDTFLITACNEDQAMLAEVRNLLLAHEQAGSFLEKPANVIPVEAETLINKTDYSGRQIGPWQIVRKIGSGGMGEVYRARDTRLGREVAIKVLPSAFSHDPDRLRRFELEARATSALNHPNILTIYDIGNHEGSPYIVAELLEGEELRAALKNGALPLRNAIEYAQQIAQGLAAAHEKGVVHRDLKPENLFVTTDGRVKILDFGIARMNPPRNGSSGSEFSTQKQFTEPGTVMGTVGYMSPEQLRGEEADHRTDIFAFGAILYEMLTGQRAFQGKTAAEVMAAILKDDPPQIAPDSDSLPPALKRIVRHCLEKRPEQRFQSARDLSFALEALSERSGANESAGSSASADSQAATHRQSRLLWGAAIFALGAVVAGISVWLLASRSTSQSAISQAVKRMTIKLPDSEPLASAKFGPNSVGRTSIALSPDGTLLVYAGERNGKSQLYLRPLDQFDAKPILGTEGAYDPFFSPDGLQVGFFAGDKLKKVSLQGGEPMTLCDTRISFGASWGPDDTIVFADAVGGNLSQIQASGGSPKVLLKLTEDVLEGFNAQFLYPQFLPGGKAVLFSIWPIVGSPDSFRIGILSLKTGKWHILLEGGTNPRYAASGHIVFARTGGILAVPFDLSRLEVTGPAVTLVEGIRIEEWGATQFTLSPEGTLVYVSGSPAWIGKLT